MIVGEAKTDAEATEFAQTAKVALDARGYINTISPESVKLGISSDAWYPVIYEDGKIIALMVGTPYNSIKGMGTLIEMLIAAKDYPDPMKATDAIILFTGNRLAAEGRYLIRADLPLGFSSDYHTKMLGLEIEYAGTDTVTGERSVILWGTIDSVMKVVLERRPEWALSL